MSENHVFYDREVISDNDIQNIQDLADVVYQEYGISSTDTLISVYKENPEFFIDNGIKSKKEMSLLAANLSVIPFIQYINNEENTNEKQSKIRSYHEKLSSLDKKRGVKDVDLYLSNIFLDRCLNSEDEVISDVACDIVIENNQSYVFDIKKHQSNKRMSLIDYSSHIKKVDRDIAGGGSRDKGGYSVDLYNVFPENDGAEDIAENWLIVYQNSKKCSREEAIEALNKTTEYYLKDDRFENNVSLLEHIKNDSVVRYGEMISSLSYSEYQSLMQNPDMVSFDNAFKSNYFEYAEQIYSGRALSDADAKRRLKKASERYRVHQELTEINDLQKESTLDR